jgi:hypothetical protein
MPVCSGHRPLLGNLVRRQPNSLILRYEHREWDVSKGCNGLFDRDPLPRPCSLFFNKDSQHENRYWFAAILFAVPCAASDPQRDVVSSYYPDDLATGRNLTPGLKPGLQQSDYAATDFAKLTQTGTGPAYLVAAYSNGWRGAIRVLHFDGTS